MKKKETLWELLKRLDEDAATYNDHLAAANKLIDKTEKKTQKILQTHQQDLHKTITKVKKAIRALTGIANKKKK